MTLSKHVDSLMSPDSQIAKQVQCGKIKCPYLIYFEMAPSFQEQLIKKSAGSRNKVIVISFDELLSKGLQKEQMDIIARFCDKAKNKVSSRYLTSQFLGHTRAADLLQKFKEASSKTKCRQCYSSFHGWAKQKLDVFWWSCSRQLEH